MFLPITVCQAIDCVQNLFQEYQEVQSKFIYTVASRNWSELPESVWIAEKCTLQTRGPGGLRTDQTQFRTLLLTSTELGWWLYVLVCSAWQLSVEDFTAIFLAMIVSGWLGNCRQGRSPVTNWTLSPVWRPQLCGARLSAVRPVMGPATADIWDGEEDWAASGDQQWAEEAVLKTKTSWSDDPYTTTTHF